MGIDKRRSGFRIPLQMFMNEYVSDKSFRCMSVNVSPTGLYLNRLKLPFKRKNQIVGLEFELPGTTETIWAKGEVRYDTNDAHFHGTGVEITGIAQAHQRLIHDYVMELRARQLRKLLAMVRRNRMH